MGIRGKLGKIKRFAVSVKNDGLSYTLDKRDYNKRKAVQPFTDIDYAHWKKQHLVEGKRRKKLLEASALLKENGPVFVVMVDTSEGRGDKLNITRQSIALQVYKPAKIFYGQPSAMEEKLNEYKSELNGDIWVLKLPEGDSLAPDFFYCCAEKIASQNADICYTDHEIFTAEKPKVCLKPDFSEDYLCAYNYIGRAFVSKNREAASLIMDDYAYLLKELAEGKTFCHAPACVYEQKTAETEYAITDDDKANICKVYDKTGKYSIESVETTEIDGINNVKLNWREKPTVSVIIPNKDHIEDLETALNSLRKQDMYDCLQILVVENNSTEQETFDYYKKIEGTDNIKVLYYPDCFNYSAINNFAEKEATGDFILLMNNDVELNEEDTVSRMLSYCMLDRVGMVGIKLYYGDDTIQHAGVAVGFQGVGGHTFTGLKKGDHGYMNMADCPRRVSAVTAACLMMSKEAYEEVGGFDERYAVAFNDVDLCMKVCGTGMQILYLPIAAHHFESKTRGTDTTEEQVARFGQEVTTFLETWQTELAKGDPYYNANKSLNDMSEDRFRDIYS